MPVDGETVRLSIANTISIELERKRVVPRFTPMRAHKWAEVIFRNNFSDSIRWAFVRSDLLEDVGVRMAIWLQDGMIGRLRAEGLTDSRVTRDLIVHYRRGTAKFTAGRLKLKIHLELEMPYWGAYVDFGRGGSRRRGRMGDDGKTEFLEEIEEWVQRKLGRDDPALARLIWKRINKRGIEARPFLGETLLAYYENGVMAQDIYRWWTEVFREGFEQALDQTVEEIGHRGGAGVQVLK